METHAESPLTVIAAKGAENQPCSPKNGRRLCRRRQPMNTTRRTAENRGARWALLRGSPRFSADLRVKSCGLSAARASPVRRSVGLQSREWGPRRATPVLIAWVPACAGMTTRRASRAGSDHRDMDQQKSGRGLGLRALEASPAGGVALPRAAANAWPEGRRGRRSASIPGSGQRGKPMSGGGATRTTDVALPATRSRCRLRRPSATCPAYSITSTVPRLSPDNGRFADISLQSFPREPV
jgi:hypothetical protein